MVAPVFASSVAGANPTAGAPSGSGGSIDTTDRSAELFGGDAVKLVGPAGRTSGSAGFSFRLSTTSVIMAWNLQDSSGNICFRLNRSSGAIYNVQYWDGAAWQNIGATFTAIATTYYNFRLDFSGLASGAGTASWSVVVNSSEVPLANDSGTGLNFASIANVKDMACSNSGTGDMRFGNEFIRDGSGTATYVYTTTENANGGDVDGTGTFSSINDVGTTYDSTFISLPSSGNHRSVKSAARSYGGRSILGVAMEARLRCGATGPTQCKPYLKIGGTRYYYGTVTLTTSFVSYTFVWTLDPSTSAAWTATNAEAAATEWGIEVV